VPDGEQVRAMEGLVAATAGMTMAGAKSRFDVPRPPSTTASLDLLLSPTTGAANAAVKAVHSELAQLELHRQRVAAAAAAVADRISLRAAHAAGLKKQASIAAIASELAPLRTQHAALVSSLGAVSASLAALQPAVAALDANWSSSLRALSAEEVVTRASELASDAQRALTEARSRDALVLGEAPIGGVVTGSERDARVHDARVRSLRDKLAREAPALLSEFDALLPLAAPGSGSSSGSSAGRPLSGLPTSTWLTVFSSGTRSERASGASEVVLQQPINGMPASVRGFQRFGSQLCWLFSLVQLLAASPRVRRVASSVAAPSFCSPAAALLSMVASATGAFTLTAAQVLDAAVAIASSGGTARDPIDLHRPQSMSEMLLLALSAGSTTRLSRDFRRLLLVDVNTCEQALTPHTPACVNFSPATGARHGNSTIPAVIVASPGTVSMMHSEDRTGKRLPLPSFATRVVGGSLDAALQGAGVPPSAGAAAAAAPVLCLDRLASLTLACYSNPMCQPQSGVTGAACGLPLLRHDQTRFTSAPGLLALCFDAPPGHNGSSPSVHVPPCLSLMSVGGEATPAAAAAAAPRAAWSYTLCSYAQLEQGHFTATIVDGNNREVHVDDDRITPRAPGGGGVRGLSVAIYDRDDDVPPVDGALVPSPPVLSPDELVPRVVEVLGGSAFGERAYQPCPEVICLSDSDDDEESSSGGSGSGGSGSGGTGGAPSSGGPVQPSLAGPPHGHRTRRAAAVAAAGAASAGGGGVGGDAGGAAAAVAAGGPHAPARGVRGRKRAPSRGDAAAAVASEGGASSSSSVAGEVVPPVRPHRRQRIQASHDEGGGGEVDDDGEEDAVDEEGGGGADDGGRGEEEDAGFRRLSKKEKKRRAAAQRARAASQRARPPRAHGKARRKKGGRKK